MPFVFCKDSASERKESLLFIPECRLSYAKMVQGESNDKVEKQSFYNFGIAEPKFILCKDEIKYHSRKMISLNLHREKPKRCRLFPIVGLTARRHTYEHMIRGWSKTDCFVL